MRPATGCGPARRPARLQLRLPGLQGLRFLYGRTGRDVEWARLVADITPDFTVTGNLGDGRAYTWRYSGHIPRPSGRGLRRSRSVRPFLL